MSRWPTQGWRRVNVACGRGRENPLTRCKEEGAMEKRFGVISADGHCRLMHLPFDLWTKRLPRKFQDDGPRVVSGPDGTRRWVVEGRPWSGDGWAGVGRGPVNCYTRAGIAEEPEPGIFRAANARD